MSIDTKAGSLLDIAQRTALDAVLRVHRTEASEAWTLYYLPQARHEVRESFEEYTARSRREARACRNSVRESWLRVATPEVGPLVGWIVRESAYSFMLEADDVLENLIQGASLADLDKYAKDQDWCDDWTDMRHRALVAFPELRTGGAA